MVRIALVEGGRAGMLEGTESVRVKADMEVGRREMRRWERSILACVSSDVRGARFALLVLPELRIG